MSMSIEKKYELLSENIRTAAGRQRLAASMVQPLRRRRDYSSVGRKAFYVEQLPDPRPPLFAVIVEAWVHYISLGHVSPTVGCRSRNCNQQSRSQTGNYSFRLFIHF